MSNDLYPDSTVLKGLTWGITRTPQFQTVVHKSVSGREVRAKFQQQPIDTWELGYSRLLETSEFQTLIGFYKKHGGAFDSFLITTPSDMSVTAQLLGAGDGATQDFPFLRTMGGFDEFVENCAPTVVYVDGSSIGSAYSVTSINGGFANNLHLNAAPASTKLVQATFTYSWRVRFAEDTLQFNNFLSKLWENKSVKLMQVLL